MSAANLSNVSWFGPSPVEFLADSPHLVIFDPLALDALKGALTSNILAKAPPDAVLELLEHCHIGYYEMNDFRPGFYRLDLHDICKFGSEQDKSDEEWEASGCPDDDFGQNDIRWFGTDSACLLIVAMSHLREFVDLFSWETYERVCQAPVGDNTILYGIIKSLGGPFFALIRAPGEPFDFDGDGTYTLQKGSVKPVQHPGNPGLD